MDDSKKITQDDSILKSVLKQAGYIDFSKITNTLQGSVWRASHSSSKKDVVIKIASKYLHQHSMAFVKGKIHTNVKENIFAEARILKHLSHQQNVPKSIIKYHAFLESDRDYFLIMEYGGCSLFDFIVKAHKIISMGTITISEWHKVVKIIFKQMVECIEFIHAKSVCHFDVSLENWVINDVNIQCDKEHMHMEFVKDEIQIKLVDFGLASAFTQKYSNDVPVFESNKHVGKKGYKSPEIISHKTYFNAASNDIWCMGVCMFIMITGSCPWNVASETDQLFNYIMNGRMKQVLKSWNKYMYVTDNIIQLLQVFFQYEDKRIDIKNIKKYAFWEE